MFSIQEQCSQFKNNVLNSRTMFTRSHPHTQSSKNVVAIASLTNSYNKYKRRNKKQQTQKQKL